MAESLLAKQQLLILNRSRQRSPLGLINVSIRQGHGMPVIKRWDSSDMDSIYKMSFFIFSLEYVPKGHGRVVKWASFLRPSWNIINKNRNYSGPWEPGDLNSPPRMRRGGRDAVEDGVVRRLPFPASQEPQTTPDAA